MTNEDALDKLPEGLPMPEDDRMVDYLLGHGYPPCR